MNSAVRDRVTPLLAFLEQELGTAQLDKLLRDVGAKAGGQRTYKMTSMQEAKLLQDACTQAGDRTLAARAGLSFRDSKGLSAYIARSSADLRAAVIEGGRYYALQDPTTTFVPRLVGRDEGVEVVSSDGALLRQSRFQEFLLFGLLSRLRAIAEADFHPVSISFRHATHPDARQLERLGGCTVSFGASENFIALRPGLLDRPLPGFDPVLVEYLTQISAAELAAHEKDRPSLRQKIEHLIMAKLPGHMPDSDSVSRELGMSRRTLSRKLDEEGVSFREIVDELRYDIARTYLNDGLSINEIAFYLGYSDQASFATAFKRWSGQSPSAYRSFGHNRQ